MFLYQRNVETSQTRQRKKKITAMILLQKQINSNNNGKS